jgi:hypothetical protein
MDTGCGVASILLYFTLEGKNGGAHLRAQLSSHLIAKCNLRAGRNKGPHVDFPGFPVLGAVVDTAVKAFLYGRAGRVELAELTRIPQP